MAARWPYRAEGLAHQTIRCVQGLTWVGMICLRHILQMHCNQYSGLQFRFRNPILYGEASCTEVYALI